MTYWETWFLVSRLCLHCTLKRYSQAVPCQPSVHSNHSCGRLHCVKCEQKTITEFLMYDKKLFHKHANKIFLIRMSIWPLVKLWDLLLKIKLVLSKFSQIGCNPYAPAFVSAIARQYSRRDYLKRTFVAIKLLSLFTCWVVRRCYISHSANHME